MSKAMGALSAAFLIAFAAFLFRPSLLVTSGRGRHHFYY